MPPAEASVACGFAELPLALARLVLALLPVDQRLRCAEVCRAWRRLLRDVRMWTTLDLSRAGGVAPAHLARVDSRTSSLLLAAALRASGQLQVLDVSGCRAVAFPLLRGVVAASSRTLRELRVADVAGGLGSEHVTELLQAIALVNLRSFCVDRLVCRRTFLLHLLGPILRNEAPFAAVRMRRLRVHGERGMGTLALCADAAEHTALEDLCFEDVHLGAPAALEALVDAAVTRRLAVVSLLRCDLSAGAAPALARLVRGGAVTELAVSNERWSLWSGEPGAALLGDALRTSALVSLQLSSVNLWAVPAAARALLSAVTGHPTLRKLDISRNETRDAAQTAAAAAALGALVAADTLLQLNVSYCALGDVALAPLVAALPRSARLCELSLLHEGEGGGVAFDALTETFARDALLPAVRANASLRVLRQCRHEWDSMREAVALVDNREELEG
jgi:hypothetical protein